MATVEHHPEQVHLVMTPDEAKALYNAMQADRYYPGFGPLARVFEALTRFIEGRTST